MAANVENAASADSEARIEKYLRSVLAVENILTLDRVRQEVAVKEQLTGKGKLYRKSLSSPNVNRLSGSRQDLNPPYSLATYKYPKVQAEVKFSLGSPNERINLLSHSGVLSREPPCSLTLKTCFGNAVVVLGFRPVLS
nr:kinesin-like protein KIF13B [Zootoca vivipara]